MANEAEDNHAMVVCRPVAAGPPAVMCSQKPCCKCGELCWASEDMVDHLPDTVTKVEYCCVGCLPDDAVINVPKSQLKAALEVRKRRRN